MAYPGDGNRMSNYGLKEWTPEETASLWKEVVKRVDRLHENHLATKGDGSVYWPGVQGPDPAADINGYFNRTKDKDETSIFDGLFHIQHTYNSKMHRDDRHSILGLGVHSEECSRRVPVLSSSAYGRLVDKPHDETSELRKHVRIERVMKGFYRTRGTGLSPQE